MLAALALLAPVTVTAQTPATGAPQNLQDAGLYADFKTLAVDPKHLAFTPQYPLWSDGAAKRRWLSLPPGGVIDGSDPDAWVFPIGTRFWKEFSFRGQRIETRYLERQADGAVALCGLYVEPDGREATLTSQKGRRNAYQLAAGRSHTIPSVNDCKACHQGGRTEILGFSTLQLSRDRDPGAMHAEPRSIPDVDVNYLIEKGLLVGFPQAIAGSTHCCGIGDGARCARLHAWQLRALPQRPGAAEETRIFSCGMFRQIERNPPPSPPPLGTPSRSRPPGNPLTLCCASSRAIRKPARCLSEWPRATLPCRCRRSEPNWPTRTPLL